MASGRIERVAIGWTIETADGPKRTAISLADFRRYCRRERVDDLMDDLQLLCEDVQAAFDRQDQALPARSA
jgi:hypothetical protein